MTNSSNVKRSLFTSISAALLLASVAGTRASARNSRSKPLLLRRMTYSTPDQLYPPNAGYYNVKAYGAKGDGIADDTKAIRAAMQAALAGANQPNRGSGSRGNTVYFPAGTYLVSDSLMWTQDPAIAAKIVATVSGGAITGFRVEDGGSGYFSVWGNGKCGLWIAGGGGSGVISTRADIRDGKVVGVDMGGAASVGRGFTSPPEVQAVNWRAYLRFEGQNKKNTILRLKDRAPGFADPNVSVSVSENLPRPNAKAVIYAGNEGSYDSIGAGEDAYMNDLWNLTVDTGKENPGAIAIDWIGSNRASIRNVDILSEDGAGRCGLNVSRNVGGGGGGPGYVKNVSISGFDYGIDADSASGEVGYAFECIDLAHQRICGVLNRNMPNWFRKVGSLNSVPVFVNRGIGSMAVVDGRFSGGSPDRSAIVNETGARQGLIYARDIEADGYRSALATGAEERALPGKTVKEYAFPAVTAQFPSRMTALDLGEIPNAPDWTDNRFKDWADVSTFSEDSEPNSGRDAAPGIQAAMNSGKPVIFFPHGNYMTTATIHVPGSVRKILGSCSFLRGPDGKRQDFPVFSFDSTSGEPVEFRNFVFDIETVGKPTFLDNGSSDLVIADVHNANGYANTDRGTGRLFLENVSMPGTNRFTNQTVYARQLDVEDSGTHNIVNGGTVWVFGFKSEYASELWRVNRARFELIGSFGSGAHGPAPTAAFSFRDSEFSLSGVVMYGGWPTAVTETRGGETKTLPANHEWQDCIGLGLYSGVPSP